MQVIDDLSRVEIERDSVLTIGAFDGIHLGHQHLIGQLVRRATDTGCLAGLVTFHPHPSVVLAHRSPAKYLTTPGEKIAIFTTLGLDLVALLPFDQEMARTPAREFVACICLHLRMKELWVGADFALGHNREGDVKALQEMGREMGFSVRAIEPLLWEGRVISSTWIRSLVERGQVEEAARLLNRYPSLSGEVMRGAQRGRCLGFPTANLKVREERAIPADGVYAVYVVLGEKRYRGVANLGVRPTFENGQHAIEVHLLDFQGDLYGCDLVVEFVARLRPERRFEKLEDLKAQIEADISHAREVLALEKYPSTWLLMASSLPQEPFPKVPDALEMPGI